MPTKRRVYALMAGQKESQYSNSGRWGGRQEWMRLRGGWAVKAAKGLF